VGRVIEHFHMAKHFELTITYTSFAFRRWADAIAAEAALDGLYVIRTSVAAAQISAEQAVAADKSLAQSRARLPLDQDGAPAGCARSFTTTASARVRTRSCA